MTRRRVVDALQDLTGALQVSPYSSLCFNIESPWNHLPLCSCIVVLINVGRSNTSTLLTPVNVSASFVGLTSLAMLVLESVVLVTLFRHWNTLARIREVPGNVLSGTMAFRVTVFSFMPMIALLYAYLHATGLFLAPSPLVDCNHRYWK
ncbi:hypothetical protein L218DRAFT_233482 [Marasmius fiardii PR-910]|nr:hypothetical protein L218DRAFT_233482 [Marasmius fiardii PR-910]